MQETKVKEKDIEGIVVLIHPSITVKCFILCGWIMYS